MESSNTGPLKIPSFLRKKFFKILFGLVGTGGSFFCLLRFGHWQDLRYLSSGLVLVLISLTLVEMYCRAERLRRACCRMNHTISLRQGIWVNAIGDVFGAMTPSSVGGELSRLASLVHLKLKAKQAMKVIALERFSLFMALALVVSFGGVFLFAKNPTLFSMPSFKYTVFLYSALAVCLLIGLFIAAKIKKTKIQWKDFFLRIDLISLGAVHHLIRLSLIPLITYWMTGHEAPLLVYVWAFILGYGLTLIPVPSGGGSVEIAFMTAMSPLVTTEKASVILVIWRLAGHYIYVAVGALITLMSSGLKSEKLEEMAFLAEEGSHLSQPKEINEIE